MKNLPGKQEYLIEMGVYCERFTGDDPDSWFWGFMDALQLMIVTWSITRKPKDIRILVKREDEDRGMLKWLLVKKFEPSSNREPWIDVEGIELDRDYLYMIGQALAMAWRSQDAKAIAAKFATSISATNPCAEIVI